MLQLYRADQQTYLANIHEHKVKLCLRIEKDLDYVEGFWMWHLTWKSAVTEPPQTSINSVMS